MKKSKLFLSLVAASLSLVSAAPTTNAMFGGNRRQSEPAYQTYHFPAGTTINIYNPNIYVGQNGEDLMARLRLPIAPVAAEPRRVAESRQAERPRPVAPVVAEPRQATASRRVATARPAATSLDNLNVEERVCGAVANYFRGKTNPSQKPITRRVVHGWGDGRNGETHLNHRINNILLQINGLHARGEECANYRTSSDYQTLARMLGDLVRRINTRNLPEISRILNDMDVLFS